MKPNRWSVVTPLLVLILVLAAAGLPAAPATLRLGTVVPVGSPWEEALLRLASRWSELSGGEIRLRIYPGGSAGDEPDLIRKMRIGQLQAAALSQLGLSQMALPILSLSIPFLIRDGQELDYVFEKLQPRFEQLLAEQGMQVIFWSTAGWVRFFAREPLVYPEDLRRLKLAVPAGDAEILEAWRQMGFQAVPLSPTDFLTALQTGMADALYAPPLLAAAFEWFGPANHMSGLVVSPVIGAVVVSRRHWERLPEDLRGSMLEAARQIGTNLDRRLASLEQEAVEAMQERGLAVDPLPPEAEARWREVARQGIEKAMGNAFSRETYEQILAYVQEHRQDRQQQGRLGTGR